MKKNIYIAIAVAAVAVGCTKSNLVDAPEAQQTPISFETYTGKTPTTKAVSETTETLAATYNSTTKTALHVNAFVPGTYTGAYTSLDVWCSSYTADNTQTQENEFSASWTYSNKAYWPSNGQLDFIAYGNNAADHLTPISGSLTSFTYTVDDVVSEQEDLLVAVTPTTGSMPTNGVVSLNFKHLLSRVGFTLKTTQAHEDVSVTIKSIVLEGENFAPTGTINFLDAEGALVTEPSIAAVVDADVESYSLFDTSYPAASYDYFFTADSPGPDNGIGIYPNMKHTADGGELTSGISENNRYMMLIPGATITSAEVYYQLPGAVEQHARATLISPITLEKGKAYEFIIKISTDAIEFSGEVTNWDPANGTDTPVPQQ